MPENITVLLFLLAVGIAAFIFLCGFMLNYLKRPVISPILSCRTDDIAVEFLPNGPSARSSSASMEDRRRDIEEMLQTRERQSAVK